MKVDIVLGLGFGDEGKGKTVDYLCSQASNPLVIRFSGGPQAGHTVIYNNIKHVFSSFGSGTLRGVPTYFTEDTCVYLNSLDTERELLVNQGITPMLTIHPLAKLITPYDIYYGRKRDEQVKHGTVGLGVGACMKRSKEGYNLYAIDLLNFGIFKEKVRNIGKYYKLDINIDVLDRFFTLAQTYLKSFNILNYEISKNYDHLIFEGSQGILLDMDHGIFPNVTYANTTSKNIWKYFPDDLAGLDISTYYVSRCYQTRHGFGYMSNKENIKLINNQDEINTFNEFQKEFRVGKLDYDLLKYALSIDELYTNTDRRNLHITCVDQLPEFKLDIQQFKDFKLSRIYTTNSAKN